MTTTIDLSPLTAALDEREWRIIPAARHLRRQRQEAGQ